jgi:hypothetical protein
MIYTIEHLNPNYLLFQKYSPLPKPNHVNMWPTGSQWRKMNNEANIEEKWQDEDDTDGDS